MTCVWHCISSKTASLAGAAGSCNHQHRRDEVFGVEETVVACKPLRPPHPCPPSKGMPCTECEVLDVDKYANPSFGPFSQVFGSLPRFFFSFLSI